MIFTVDGLNMEIKHLSQPSGGPTSKLWKISPLIWYWASFQMKSWMRWMINTSVIYYLSMSWKGGKLLKDRSCMLSGKCGKLNYATSYFGLWQHNACFGELNIILPLPTFESTSSHRVPVSNTNTFYCPEREATIIHCFVHFIHQMKWKKKKEKKLITILITKKKKNQLQRRQS